MEELQARIEVLEAKLSALEDYSTIPLKLENAFIARGFFKLANPLGTGSVYATNGVFSVVTGGSKGVYVATSPGGSPTNFMQVTNGIVTSI